MAESQQVVRTNEATQAAQALKSAVLALIQHDPEVIGAIRGLMARPGTGQMGQSDAEHAAVVMTLIETQVQRLVRPDSLRRAPQLR